MVDAKDFTVQSSTSQYCGPIFEVRTDEVRMPDGSVGRRDVIVHPGAVGIVAVDELGRVAMVRQYRHPVRQFLLELPAGLLDVNGEAALAAAARELFEEAAITASEWHVLLDLHTSPGMSDESIRVFLARELSHVAEADRFVAEAEELSLTVEWHPLEDLVQMALAGELTNGPAVAGVLAASHASREGWHGLRPVGSPWRARAAIPAS